jgi:hypothetical protein
MNSNRFPTNILVLAVAVLAVRFAATAAYAKPQDDIAAQQHASMVVVAAPNALSDEIPIGAVMDWWRPTETTPLPEGFMLCDGSTVTAAYSPIQGETTPDASFRFARGLTSTDSLPPAGYTTGGTDQHIHSYSWSHHHFIPHIHDPLSGMSGGSQGFTGNTCYGGLVPWQNLAYRGHEHAFTTIFPLYNGFTELEALEFDTQSATNQPEYVGLLKICWIGIEEHPIYLPLIMK